MRLPDRFTTRRGLMRWIIVVMFFQAMCLHGKVRFEVTAINGETACLRADAACAPGTIVVFDPPEGSAQRTLLLVAKERSPGIFEGVARVGKVSADLKVGQLGESPDPRFNHRVAHIQLDAPERLTAALLSRIRSPFIAFNAPVGSAALFTLGVKKSEDKRDWIAQYTSPFWSRGLSDRGTLDELVENLGKVIEAESEGYYWLSLDNPYFAGNARATLRAFGATAKEFEKKNAAVVPAGHQLEFEITAGEVGGTFCLLEIGSRGRMKIISPPRGMEDELQPFASQRRRLPPVATDLEAENVSYVVVISRTPRPLASFLPRGRTLSNLLVVDSLESALDLNQRGPGYFSNMSEELSPLESLDPGSWDVARIHVQIVSK